MYKIQNNSIKMTIQNIRAIKRGLILYTAISICVVTVNRDQSTKIYLPNTFHFN